MSFVSFFHSEIESDDTDERGSKLMERCLIIGALEDVSPLVGEIFQDLGNKGSLTRRHSNFRFPIRTHELPW